MSRLSPRLLLLLGPLCAYGLALSCNPDLGGGGGGGDGVDMAAGPGVCEGGCPAPQVCSKAGGGCIAPGTCFGDADCNTGQICATPDGGTVKTCVVGGRCGGQKIAAEAVPPNLLVVLDRSCSMTGKVGTSTKWAIAVDALTTLTKTYKDKIRFGLTLFPDRTNDNCTQDAIPVPVAPGNEAKIQTLLSKALVAGDTNYPDGPCVTNIDTAVQQASTDPALKDATRANYALLVTDGQQSGCNAAGGAAGATTIVGNMYQKNKIATFVVGFGTGVSATELNDLAKAGGVPTGMATSYYQAEDQASLNKALQSIASQTIGCVFQLATAPPNPQQLYVWFDKTTKVPRDTTHKNGWDYDEVKKQVVFYGAACDSLRTGAVKAVDVIFGCDTPPIG